ncbi:hypothetical protein VNO78_14968 [Psophocarpus tetragonolobus]|uniref:Uncharacterized protein n=1 Tax=Psophocarpus tetragonolobus TaxID=3891 RepID=A0AAN9XJ72_PSOTE
MKREKQTKKVVIDHDFENSKAASFLVIVFHLFLHFNIYYLFLCKRKYPLSLLLLLPFGFSLKWKTNSVTATITTQISDIHTLLTNPTRTKIQNS